MALAPFFDRIYGAVGRHLTVSRETLEYALGTLAPEVVIGRELDANSALIADLTVNLLARLYPRIALVGDALTSERLGKTAARINPRIELISRSETSPAICVGAVQRPDALYPSASGWVAELAHSSTPDRSASVENPYASSAAATLAVAELFRRLFIKTPAERDVRLSLLDFSDSAGQDTPLGASSLGDVLFVGVGAVGNAGLWTLARHRGLTGRLILIDPDRLSLLNLQRYVLGGFEDVGRTKVEVGAALLRETQVAAEAGFEQLDAFVDRNGGRIAFPSVCVSVDNIAARRAAQAMLPRLVVNGWTGDAGLGASWHELSRDTACLACLYQPSGVGLSAPQQAAAALGLPEMRAAQLWVTREPLGDADLRMIAEALGVDFATLAPWRRKPLGEIYTDVVCGAVPLDIKGIGKVEVVPLAHQSVLAGVFMAAELVKRTSAELSAKAQLEPLVSWENVLRPLPPRLTRPAARVRGCICGDEIYQAVYAERWARPNG